MMVKHFSSDAGVFFYRRGLPVDRVLPGAWERPSFVGSGTKVWISDHE